MSGLFDDILPPTNTRRSGGLFDDVLSQEEEERKRREQQSSGFFSGLGSAVAEGAEKTYRSARAALSTYLNIGDDVVTQAGETARIEKDSRASDLKALKQDIQQRKLFDDDSIWSGIKNVAGAVVDNPRGAAQLVAEQAPNSAVALGSGLAGAKGGALVGSAFGPVGTAVGGTVGFLAGLFGANTLLETGGKAIEASQDKQFTPEERSQAIREGTTKGAVITAVDAATLGASKFVLGAANRAVEQATMRTLSDAGVDATKAAASIRQAQREALEASRGASRQATQEAVEKATVDAMGKAGLLKPDLVSAVQAAQKSAFDTTTTLGKRAGRGGAALGLESFGEGFGEGLGEYAATGEFSPTEAVLESVAGLSMSLPELYVAKGLNAPGELTSAYSARRPDAPPAPPPAPGALEQLGTATRELEQSVTSYLTPDDVMQSASVDEAVAKATELAAAPLPGPTLDERILAAEAPGLVSRQLEIQRQLDEQAGLALPPSPTRGAAQPELPPLQTGQARMLTQPSVFDQPAGTPGLQPGETRVLTQPSVFDAPPVGTPGLRPGETRVLSQPTVFDQPAGTPGLQPGQRLDTPIPAPRADRTRLNAAQVGVDREAQLLEQREGTLANPIPERLRLDAQRRDEAAGLIESNPQATPDILARANALRAEAQSLRTRADEIAATSAATSQPAAGTQFEREQLDAQAAVNREMRLPARESAAAKYADLTPMTPLQARQRLVVLQDQSGQPLSLEITPHPTQKGAFAIAERELLSAADLEISAPAPAPVSAAEAQNRIESAELGGREQRRKRLDEGRQIVVTRALKNVEERGGVASPQEAQIFQEAGLGRPYDSIDESLGPKPGLVLPQMEERGPATTGGGIITDSGVSVGRRDRQARGFGVNAALDFAPTGLQATTSLGAAPDTRVDSIEPTGLVRSVDEPAPTGGRSATKQSEIPAVPGLPGVADTLNVNLAGQAGATDQQNATLLGEPRDPGTELAKQRVAAGYQAPPAAPRPQKVNGTAVAQLTNEQLTQIAGDEKLPAIARRGAQIELGYRASETPAPAAATAPATAALPETTATQAPKLDQPRPGVILTSNAKMSSARPAGPGATGMLNDNGVQHTYTVVDPGKLGTPGKLISQVARIFGKKLVVFESDSLQSDGFVLDDDSSSVYLNAKSSVSPLAVFGHEMVHLLKRDNAQAYAALEAVVRRNVDAAGMGAFEADYGQGANLEELASDLTGNRFQEPEFWTDVFGEIAAQNPTGARAVILRVAAALNKAVNAFKSAVSGQGFKADQYVKDLDAVKAAVKSAVVQYAQQQREPAMRMEAELMRAESQVNLTAGSSAPAGVSQAAVATAAPASVEDELAEVEAQTARFSPDRGYDTDAYEGEGRGRAVDTARAAGVSADAGQDRSAFDRDGGGAAPSYGTAREGAVSVLARHYSRQPRQSLNGGFFGTGLKGAERDRLASSPDPRIRSRVYFYVDNGNGIRPESGVGGYAHEVQLNNIYDPATRLVSPQPNANSFESAVLNAGFDGYIDRQFTTQQGAVVLLGPKHADVPVRQLGQVAAGAAPAPAVAGTLKRSLMSRELNSIDTANIPGARVRMGNLEIPADQAAAANAELQRIGSTARFSAKRGGPEASAQAENRMAVVVGAKPGEFNWNFTRSDLTPPPFSAPTQYGPRLEKIGESVYEILRSNGFKKLAEDAFGIKGLRVAPLHGSWLNKPEPSFALYADGLTFDQANEMSKMLGFAFAQDATVVFQPTSEQSPGEIPAVYVGGDKKLTDQQMKAVLSSAQAEGIDYSSTADGKAVRFLHFGDDAGLAELMQKTARIASSVGLGAPKVVYVRSQLNEAESYTKGSGGSAGQAVWFGSGGTGRPDLFRRTVDHVLVPYAKAVGAEGYRFAVSRFGQRFGLSADQQGLIRQALLPKSGSDKSTVDIASGKVKLEIKPTGARGVVSVSDILWALQNRSAQAGLIEPGDYSDQARKLIAEAIAEEVLYNISDTSSGKSAIGWYDRALKAAKAKYTAIFPEIQADRNRGLLFDAVLGITSQGNDVFSNSIFAARVYELVTRQNMTLGQAVSALKGSFGGETVAIENNILKLEELLDRNGYDAMRKFFNRKDTVSNINARLRSDTSLFYKNKPLSVDGAADQRVTGWMVFGPKIGSFINNLHGDYSTLTADLWFSRTWNRLLGFSFVHAPAREAEQYQTFMSALVAEYGFVKDREGPIQPKQITKTGEAKMPEFGNDAAALTDTAVSQIIADPDAALRYATELEAVYRKGGYKVKSDLRRAAKNWIENRNDPVALPRTDYERDFQQRTAETAQKIIKRRTGKEITIADIQAALWYYEKDNLFKLLGGTNKKSEAADYAGAAEETVRSYQGGDLFYAKTDARYVYGSKGSYIPGAQLSRARPGVDLFTVSQESEQAEKPTAKRSTQDVSRIFSRMVKDAENALTSALFNWNDSRLNEDKDKIILYPGRDARFVRGKEGGKSNVSKAAFIDWLMSDAPFDTSVYGEEISRDAEWKQEIETLRKIVDPTPAPQFSRARTPLGFYSALAEGVDGIKTNSAPAQGWKDAIKGLVNKGQVKADEVEWSGLNDWLDLQQGKVTKQQVADYLAQGGVQVDETVLGGPPTKEQRDRLAQQQYGENYDTLPASIRQGLDDDLANDAGPRYDQYTLPGGENYREVLLTLPKSKVPSYDEITEFAKRWVQEEFDRRGTRFADDQKLVDAIKDDIWAWNDLWSEGAIKHFGLKDTGRLRPYGYGSSRTTDAKPADMYESKHWDQPNVLAHIRVNDRTDAGGNRVLFVEELQSDWGQEGKKSGFLGDLIPQNTAWQAVDTLDTVRTRAEAEAKLEELQPFLERNREPGMESRLVIREGDGFFDIVEESRSPTETAPRRYGVPRAPFVTKTEGWLNLALKRVMVMAAEGGYDKVAFANGEQSADRYDLSKKVERIEYEFLPADTVGLIKAFGFDGEEVVYRAAKPEDLPDIIGKEVAAKLMDAPVVNYTRTLQGDNLKVGGEGMKAFYDTIVPTALKKLLPKVGGGQIASVQFAEDKPYRVEDDDGNLLESFATREAAERFMADGYGEVLAYNPVNESKGVAAPVAQPGFDVTDAMREKVAQGVPLFSTRRNIYGQQLLANWTAPTDSKTDTAIYYLQNKQIDLKRVIEGITAATGQIDEKWDAYLKEELYHGRTAKATKDFINDELQPLLKGMERAGVSMDDFETYLHNRHAEERNIQIASINPAMPDGGSGIDTADARSYLAGLDPAKRQAMESLAKRVDAITKETRELLVRSGLETRETIDAWEQAYGKYVPLMREDLDFSADLTASGTGQGFSVKGPSSKRATGSKREVVDIMANLAMQRERAIVRAEKSRVGTALYGLALKNPNPDFWLAVNPDAIKDPQALMQELQAMGLNPLDAKAIAEEPKQTYVDPRTGLVSQRINPAMRNRDNVLAVRINGQDRFLFFNTKDERAKRMVASLKNLDADQLGVVMGSVIAPVTRWFASVNTQYNPIFGAVNLIRDTGAGAFNLTTTEIADRKAQVMAGIPGALAGIYSALRKERKGNQAQGQWAALWEEFQQAGGQTGYRDMFKSSDDRTKALETELKKLTEGKAMQLGRGMMNWLSDYNETLENSVRLSAYKAAVDKGLSKEKAASIAKNLTVNFNRKGQVATQAGALYAFFNASVQGTKRLGETLTGPAGRKIMAGGLLLGTMQALLLAAAGYDDDEPPGFVKERNLVIPLGEGGKFIQIPMPLGLHVIPNTSRIITEWFLSGFKRTPQRVAEITGAFLDAFNPIGNAGWSLQTIAPTIVDPLAAIAENKDWQGRPIAKKDMTSTNPTPGYSRARDTATWLSKELAYYLNLAGGGTKYKPGVISPTPDQLDYLAAQVGGGVVRELQKISQSVQSGFTGEELPSYKIPVGGRFYGDIKEQSAVQSRFYDNITRLNEHEAEIKGRQKNREGGIDEYRRANPESRLVDVADRVEREVQELRRKKRELIEKNRPKESVKMIELQITRKMQQLNDRVETAEAVSP